MLKKRVADTRGESWVDVERPKPKTQICIGMKLKNINIKI